MTPLESLARAITSLPGTIVACLAILIWGGFAYLLFRSRLTPLIQELDRFCKILEELKDEAEFATRIQEIDEQVRSSPLLGHQWSEFHETLVDPTIGDDTTPVCYNTYNAEAFFSRDNLLGEHLNLRFYNALPNLLTGAGILGTFIGLVAGVYLAGGSLTDPTRVQTALGDLLSGASLAFATSIVGLIASMFFSWREKHLLHQFEKLRQRWVTGLDQRLRRITLESITRDILEESRNQTRFFSNFTENLAFQLTDALTNALEKTVPTTLDEKVTTPLTMALEELQNAVKELSHNQQRANDETLRSIVERFSESISGAAGTEMQAFANTVKTLSEQVNNQIAQVAQQQELVRKQSEESVKALADTFQQGAQGLQDKVNDSINQILIGLDTTVKGMSSGLSDAVNRMSQELGKTATAFAQATGELTGSVENIRGILTDSRELVDYLNQLMNNIRNAHAELERIAEGIGEASRATETAAGKIAQAGDQAQEAFTALKTALEAFAQHQMALERTWRQYEGRFAGLDESLAKTFQQIESGLERYAHLASNFITDLDRETGKITTTLSSAVTELDESITELSEILTRHRQ